MYQQPEVIAILYEGLLFVSAIIFVWNLDNLILYSLNLTYICFCRCTKNLGSIYDLRIIESIVYLASVSGRQYIFNKFKSTQYLAELLAQSYYIFHPVNL